MSEQTYYEADLTNPPDDVNAVHTLLETVWANSPGVDMADRFRFETALVELSGNVFEHAATDDVLTCTLAVTVFTDRLSAVMVDTGRPFVPPRSNAEGRMDKATLPDEMDESGRGLALIEALVDDFLYLRVNDTNRWTLVRRLAASQCATPQQQGLDEGARGRS